MKGIILAGGSATRLRPVTLAVSKQLLPVYDKPMIYYPMSVLMLAGIRDILVITTPVDLPQFQRLLGDGSRVGLNLTFQVQTEPRGLADAFVLGREHIGSERVALVLGDNIFHGAAFSEVLTTAAADDAGAVLFGYQVGDPERYGVAEVDAAGNIVSLEEKPTHPRSDRAVTGLYFYSNDVVKIAEALTPSPRGELEITDVNQEYVRRGAAKLVDLGRGFAWLDTGTQDSLMAAGQYVQTMEQRQGLRIACLEEVSLRMGFIDAAQCQSLGEELGASDYGLYVMAAAERARRAQARQASGPPWNSTMSANTPTTSSSAPSGSPRSSA